jgi:hypothetical protein
MVGEIGGWARSEEEEGGGGLTGAGEAGVGGPRILRPGYGTKEEIGIGPRRMGVGMWGGGRGEPEGVVVIVGGKKVIDEMQMGQELTKAGLRYE